LASRLNQRRRSGSRRIAGPALARNLIAIVDLDQCAVRPACYGRLMSSVIEHNPGDPAPETGRYEEYDVPGNPTGRIVHVNEGEPLPRGPRAFTWRLLPGAVR
jgi:hypothetical protein